MRILNIITNILTLKHFCDGGTRHVVYTAKGYSLLVSVILTSFLVKIFRKTAVLIFERILLFAI